ncbi:hypothetical protein C8T65DRAFT_695623 [Cerioporus squamosus]|nr:hypothetical protein C8T65DRAFT_695623 [Cerioporus squamosus]
MSTRLPRDDRLPASSPSDLPASKISKYSSLTGWNQSESQSGQVTAAVPSRPHPLYAHHQPVYGQPDTQEGRVNSVSSQATSGRHPPTRMHAHHTHPPPSLVTGSSSASVTATGGAQSEAVLAEFYKRKTKKPTRQEQYELCSATGMSSEAVANW